MTNKTDFEKCYECMYEAQNLISKAQEIFDLYDIPSELVSHPSYASCMLGDSISELGSYLKSLKR